MRTLAPIKLVNRSTSIDSKHSLDVIDHLTDHAHMIRQPYRIYCERHDRDQNMARYYTMEIAEDLFGQACLIRRWGRIGKRGQSKFHRFGEEREAVGLFLEILRQKQRRGYRPPPHASA